MLDEWVKWFTEYTGKIAEGDKAYLVADLAKKLDLIHKYNPYPFDSVGKDYKDLEAILHHVKTMVGQVRSSTTRDESLDEWTLDDYYLNRDVYLDSNAWVDSNAWAIQVQVPQFAKLLGVSFSPEKVRKGKRSTYWKYTFMGPRDLVVLSKAAWFAVHITTVQIIFFELSWFRRRRKAAEVRRENKVCRARILEMYAGLGVMATPLAPSATAETVTDEQQEADVKHSLNQILYGPPGTGKTYRTVAHALAIIDEVSVREREKGDVERFYGFQRSGQIAMVTFHQSYAYEDFIEGIRPVLGDKADGQIRYELHDGIFKQIADAARDERDKRFVLIIDEINRGNIAKIFGELITLIEDSRRLGANDATEVTLPYSNESFSVPDNLYLIGTMNTADRSIQLLDAALRRRFTFVEMMPKYEDISKKVEGVDCAALLETMNRRITPLLDREHQIGHTYLLGVDTIEKLSSVFQNKIFPLLQEYFFDDWSKIRAVLGGNRFVVEENTTGLFRDNEQEVEDRIYQRLPEGAPEWTDPVQYRRIYE